MIFRLLTSTRLAVWLFILLLLMTYALLPTVVNAFVPNPYFLELAQLTTVACASIAVGNSLPLFDRRLAGGAARLLMPANTFHSVIWWVFTAFLLVTFLTAESIPVVSAMRGATTNELSQQRGDFLKGRTGIESALVYISTLFVSALLPYSLSCLYQQKSRYRFLLTGLFLAYSISFLAKALFINVILPLLYLFAQSEQVSTKRLFGIIGSSALILYLVTLLAFGGETQFDLEGAAVAGDFFGAGYLPTGAVDHLLWRVFAVPMFTASDTLVVFAETFNRQNLWGATSSFLAALMGFERIPLEKLVFEYQWSWNDIASSNAVYIADAYVNFGWTGLAIMSMFVGQSLRWFSKSRDTAFKSLWMIYCLTIFSSGLIGTLLSTGYALMFIFALFVRLTGPAPTSRQTHDPRLVAENTRALTPLNPKS